MGIDYVGGYASGDPAAGQKWPLAGGNNRQNRAEGERLVPRGTQVAQGVSSIGTDANCFIVLLQLFSGELGGSVARQPKYGRIQHEVRQLRIRFQAPEVEERGDREGEGETGEEETFRRARDGHAAERTRESNV